MRRPRGGNELGAELERPVRWGPVGRWRERGGEQGMRVGLCWPLFKNADLILRETEKHWRI